MKFHPPSFVLGFASAVTLMAARRPLRPVVVELTSLGLHTAKIARGVIERQREHAEDLWAEIRARASERARGAKPVRAEAHTVNGAASHRSAA